MLKTGFSLGTNFWSGGVTDGNSQQTGVLKFRSGDFRFQYENDETPFQKIGLADGGDSHRTAAASIGIGAISFFRDLALAIGSGLKNLGKWAFTSKSIGYQSKLFGRYSKTFLPDGKMGLLNNKNNLIRLGWGPGKGAHVFRLAVGNNRTMWYKHFDIIIGPKYGF